MSFTVVSLFAGCGGSSLGYKAAGGRVLLASEFDKNAIDTYGLNHPDTPIAEGDVATLSVDEILQRTDLKPGELDILDGSPPCQGFSSAGNRQFDDARNSLFVEYVRILRGLRPGVFVMENVSGMVEGKMKIIFGRILSDLKASGYRVACRLLNAKYYGVPQSRERVIFVGVRDDLNIEPSHPQAIGRPITVREAWTRPSDIRQERGDAVKGPAALIAPHVPPGGNNGCGKYSLPIRGTIAGFGLSRLAWDKPSPTIPRLSMLSSAPLLHPDSGHRITIRQAARLATFPEDFQFIGSFNEQWARIGNSVPPRFMQAIAEHIRDQILSPITRAAA